MSLSDKSKAGFCLARRITKRTAISFIIVLLAPLMVINRLREVALVSSFLQETSSSSSSKRSLGTTTTTTTTTPPPDEDNNTILQNPSSLSAGKTQVPLYVITPTSRTALLTRGIIHMLPFLDDQNNCGFDLHWIIIHNFPDERLAKVPLFRNAFPWITELFAYNAASDYGDYERNVAIEYILNQTDTGLVYFLDDDNVLSMDLCRENARSPFRTDHMYYADMLQCVYSDAPLHVQSSSRFQNSWRSGIDRADFIVRTDTANWLTPVWLLRQEFYGDGTQGPDGVRWKLQKAPGSDALFYTGMVKALLQTDGTEDRLIQLPPNVTVNYNRLKCQKHLSHYRERPSLDRFRGLIGEMQKLRESPSFLKPEERMNQTEISFHDYVHILYRLRSSLPSTSKTATYVELGVWKGATSIYMSRHPLPTNVIGIDRFSLEHQWEEAEGYVRHLKGNGTISWIKSDSKLAVPELRNQLNGESIDILFIAGDHSVEGVLKDFELYAPLVSEGGFIVFDDFMHTAHAGVREALIRLFQTGQISLNDYDLIGCLPNQVGAGPLSGKDKYLYEWQNKMSNEFVLRKKSTLSTTTTTLK